MADDGTPASDVLSGLAGEFVAAPDSVAREMVRGHRRALADAMSASEVSDAARRADELIGMLELTGLEARTGTTLSGGQKRRLDVALGLMHSPRVLFLDEPSTGLDPHSRANLWEHILRLRRASGMTIFLTTHYLDEADSMAFAMSTSDTGAPSRLTG